MILRRISHIDFGIRGNIARFKSIYTQIKDVNDSHVGQTVKVRGWIDNFRKQSKFVFLDVKDGSTNEHLQVMIDRETHKKNSDLGYGATVTITGVVGTAPRGHLELRANHFKLNGICPVEDGIYPFVRKQNHSFDYIRPHLHLRAHMSQFQAIFRARHLASHTFHRYFIENGFIFIHTPTLTSNSCEGAGELFTVRPHNEDLLSAMQDAKASKPKENIYFDRSTFLTLSGQMHLEAMCFRLGSVYNFGPVFRAENSKSSIHMSEFYMIEAEESFIECVEDITGRIEDTIKTVTKYLLDEHAKEINDVHVTLSSEKSNENIETRFYWLEKQFEIVTYADASEVLQKQYSFDPKSGFSKSDELALVKYFGKPIFVIKWPSELKPFYMRRCRDNPELVDAIDFLMPMVGELAGGSVREENYDILQPSIPKGLEWYLDLRKYGGCTTGGFGIGFDRYLQVLLGISNIKDTIPFPRWPHHCSM